MALTKVSKQQHIEICKLFKSGETQSGIASIFGVSQERIRQILEENGLKGKDGGLRKKVEARERKKQLRFIKKYGCTKEQFDSIKGHYTEKNKSPWCAYKSQRRNAMSRGVEWNFVFWEWWQVWCESGRWNLRGRGSSRYCMCRTGDIGPYERSNVYIGTVTHNSCLGRTLAFERGVSNTLVHRLISRTGGPVKTSQLIGVKANYISQLAVRNIIPKKWFDNGRAQKLISAAGLGLSISKVFEMTNRV